MADVDVTVEVGAPAPRVWSLIGDPTRMGEWSPECHRVEWQRGATQPAVGASFKGHNRIGWRRWWTIGTITAFEPEREIAWDVHFAGVPVAHWSYRIDPSGDGGCTVTESFDDRRAQPLRLLGPVARGVRDYNAHNRAGMEATLARLKTAAEAS